MTGGSWGSTLALAYAQENPERTTGLMPAAVTTTSRAEVEWTTESVGRVFPREWEAYSGASGRRPGQRIVDAYLERITDPDPGTVPGVRNSHEKNRPRRATGIGQR